MKMYAVKEVDQRFGDSSTSYHHTFEEAEASIEGRVMHDREGDHPGREWLCIHIVERVSQPCRSCGRESENKPESYAKYPYCRGCHYTGAAADSEHMNDLAAFRTAFPDAEVGVEHTGGGCFWLAFRWEGDEFFYIATDGEASLPDKWADGWGYVGRHIEDDGSETISSHPDFYGTILREADDVEAVWAGTAPGLTKRQIIAAIKKDRKARVQAAV